MISVIVPVYNVEGFLPRCIDSLLNQTINQDYEILLINDGSTDNSSDVCKEYSEKYNNIFSFNKENGGLSSARNYGVKEAKGDLISFVDSDDYVSESYLKDLYELIITYDADMAVTRVCLQTEQELEIPKAILFDNYCLNNEEAFIEVYGGGNASWSACGKLIKKTILERHPFPSGYYEDSATMYLLLYECKKVAFGDFVNNYHYIRRDGSITACAFSEKHLRIFTVCDEIASFVENKYPRHRYITILVYQNALLQIINRLNINYADFKRLFLQYRKLFRENVKLLIQTKNVNVKYKIYNLLFCSNPLLFWVCHKLLQKLK